MEETNVEKAKWILDKIDTSGFLGKEIEKGVIYVSDFATGRSYIYNPNDSSQADLKESVDLIHKMGRNIDRAMVFHIIISNFNMNGDLLAMVNYLYTCESDVYYEDGMNNYGMVLAYVNNISWDIQEHGSVGVKMVGKLIKRVS